MLRLVLPAWGVRDIRTALKFSFVRFPLPCSVCVVRGRLAARVLRFARMKGASAAEIECALGSDACAVFDAVVRAIAV